MDIREIARSIQSPNPEVVRTAVKTLENYAHPLAEKENVKLQEFISEYRAQQEAGQKVEKIPDDICTLQCRPATPIHPLMVAQCVLAASRVPSLLNDVQKRLQRRVLPLALLRHPLQVKECAVVLQLASQLPYRTHVSCIHAGKSVLRCLALSLFPPQGRDEIDTARFLTSLRSAVSGSFALPCVKQAPTSIGHAELPGKIKECTLEDAQNMWWELLSLILDVLSDSYRDQRRHNEKGAEEGENAEEMLPITALFSLSGSLPARLPFSKALSCVGLRFFEYLASWCFKSYDSPSAAQTALEKLAGAKQIALSTLLSASSLPSSPLSSGSSIPFILSSSTVVQVIKTSPGLVSRYFGGVTSMDGCLRSMKNTLQLGKEDAERLDFAQLALYNMGLASVSNPLLYMDYLTALLCMNHSSHILRMIWKEKRGELVEQLLSPFLNNSRVLTSTVAERVAPLYAALIRRLLLTDCEAPDSTRTSSSASSTEGREWSTDVAQGVLDGCASILCNRCRTPMETSVVGHLVLALTSSFHLFCLSSSNFAAARKVFVSAVQSKLSSGLSRFIQRELASPSAESVSFILRLIAAWSIDGDSVKLSYQTALLNAKKDESIRTALLLHTPVFEPQQGCQDNEEDVARVSSPLGQEKRGGAGVGMILNNRKKKEHLWRNDRKGVSSPLVSLLKDQLIIPLLRDCVEVEVSRPDGFLSLWYVCFSPCFEAEKNSKEIFQSVLPILCTADILNGLLSPSSLSSSFSTESYGREGEAIPSFARQQLGYAMYGQVCRVVEVAYALSLSGYFTPLLRLMTHSSRWLQGKCKALLENHVQEMEDSEGESKTFHSLVLPMWRTLVSDVMGVEEEKGREKERGPKSTDEINRIAEDGFPALLSTCGEAPVHVVGRVLLSYIERGQSETYGSMHLSRDEVCHELATFLCCLGHDSIQGKDKAFFSLLDFIKIRPSSSALVPVDSASLFRFLTLSSSSSASFSAGLFVSSLSRATGIIQHLLKKMDREENSFSSPSRIAAVCRGTTLFFVLLSHYYSEERGGKRAVEQVEAKREEPEERQKNDDSSDDTLSSHQLSPVQVCFDALLQRLRMSMVELSKRSARDLALASGSVELEMDYIGEELRSQHLLKTYPDRPPKGMTAEDFLDQKKRDSQALAKGREQAEKEMKKHRDLVIRETRILLAPILTVRLLGCTNKVDLMVVSTFYPYLLRRLKEGGGEASMHSRDEKEEEEEERREFLALVRRRAATGQDNELKPNPPLPLFVYHLYMDAIRGLLSRTALRSSAVVLTAVALRLSQKRFLEAPDVSQLGTLSQLLRRSLGQMLPPPLFVVLIPFCRVAFKAGRTSSALTTSISISTQHQLLGVLLQNVGQASLPQPTLAMELMMLILHNFPSLYKSVLQGAQTLMPLIPSKHLTTIEVGLLDCGEDGGVRDVLAISFPRFSHFLSCRRALVLAQIFLDDQGQEFGKVVLHGMEEVLAEGKFDFHLEVFDWEHLLYFLRAYGGQKRNAIAIGNCMTKIFTMASQQHQEEAENMHVKWIEDVCVIGGIGSVVGLYVLSSSLHPKAAVKAIDYLCTLTELGAESHMEALLREVLDAGRVILKAIEFKTLQEIAPGMQTRLARPPKDLTTVHKEQYLAISTVWLTVVACRLQDCEVLQNIIEQQSRTLNNSQSLMVHRAVYESMAEITKNEAVRKMPQLDEFVEKCLKQCLHTGSYVKKKAHAWGIAGVISGLTLPGLRRYDIVNRVRAAAQEKQTEKIGAMILVEVLCDALGRRFEPYALELSDILLQGVGDADSHVSDCADDAVQVMMKKCLSGIGLRQLIPHLIAILSSDQAKRRVAPLNFIGHVASCSPKQLAATLPLVMKNILPCVFEVNSLVSSAAFSALRRVAGVVSNPEIKEQVENIFNAMRSPSSETENALDALLYTRFINVVDPASLALIIPIISRGLSGQVKNTRSKAAQIVATMVTLVRDPQSLTPYADELILLLQSAAQDPEPEARTTSAKALSALCGAIGLHLVHRVATWCFEVLQKTSSGTIEKAGAAQVFVELVNPYGSTLMKEYIREVKKGMTDERPGVREGFLYMMVYAPSSFDPLLFQRFLPRAFPWVLSGLSHYSDRVREVALTAGDSIIGMYGTENLDFVLGPLLTGTSSEITNLRHSSLLLASKLLLHLSSHIRKKARIQHAAEERRRQLQGLPAEEGASGDAQEAGGDGMKDGILDQLDGGLKPTGEDSGNAENAGVLTVEAARDVEKRGISLLSSLEEWLGTKRFVRLFSAVYCGCHEHALTVRTDCSQAWQACVASIRAAVKKIFPELTKRLINLASSSNPDCVEVAQKTIEFTSRMQETIEMFIQSFCHIYKSRDHDLRSHQVENSKGKKNQISDKEDGAEEYSGEDEDDYNDEEDEGIDVWSDEENFGFSSDEDAEENGDAEKGLSGAHKGNKKDKSDNKKEKKGKKKESKKKASFKDIDEHSRAEKITRMKRGCLMCLSSFVALVDSKKLISMGGQLVGCILPGMQHDDSQVQAAASELFEKVTKEVGPRLIEDAVEAQLHTSIRGVVEVVKVRPTVALQIIFRYFKKQKTYSQHDLELLNEVLCVEEAEHDLLQEDYILCILRMLLACFQEEMEDTSEVARNFIASLEHMRDYVFEQIIKAFQQPASRFAAILFLEAYGLEADVEEDEEPLHRLFQTLITVLSDEDDVQCCTEAVRIIPILITHLEKEVVESALTDEEASDVTISKRTSGRYLAQYVEVIRDSLSITARSVIQPEGKYRIKALAEGEPRLFDALMNLYQRGLDYGTPEQKVDSVEGMQDLMEFAPKAISTSAVNTLAGRCTKSLFTRNEGPVVLALLNLCAKLLEYPANGKEKMVEGTMALALFSASLCEYGEARVAALQLTIKLLQRSEKYAELILGNIMTKKNTVLDRPLYRTVLCRFVSVIMRYSHFTKKYLQIPKLMALIRPIWEESETPAEAAAGGVAVGAMCMSDSITDDELQEIKELTLRMTSSPGRASIAGFAAVYSLLTCAQNRVDNVFIEVAADALGAAEKFGSSNKFSTLWILRAAGAVVSTGTLSEEQFHADRFLPCMRRLQRTDETAMSTGQYFVEKVTTAYPSCASQYEVFPAAYSAVCADGFDADLDDEVIADQMQ